MPRPFDYDRHLEGRQVRRMKEEDRFLDKLERRERAAEQMIGELCREGRTVFYINERSRSGTLTGRVREFGQRWLATDFLLRNNYA